MSNVTWERTVVHTTGDGIEEFDNRLPRWWLATFYGSIVFGIGYWFVFHVFYLLPLTDPSLWPGTGGITRGVSCEFTTRFDSDLSRNSASVAEGEQVFASNCTACHGAKGGGIVGPNLTDEYWLHGGAPEEIGRTVCAGVPGKGMPTWGPQLGRDRIRALVAYVLTLRNTNVAGGKVPQGERLDP